MDDRVAAEVVDIIESNWAPAEKDVRILAASVLIVCVLVGEDPLKVHCQRVKDMLGTELPADVLKAVSKRSDCTPLEAAQWTHAMVHEAYRRAYPEHGRDA